MDCGKLAAIIAATALAFSWAILPDIASAGSAPPPDDLIDGIQHIDGDWTVSGAENYSNEVIYLTGDLVVTATGALELENVTLIMNCTTVQGEFGITVQGGGALYLNDTDGDPATAADRTHIRKNPAFAHGYLMQIDAGAVIQSRNSEVSGCGLLASMAGWEMSGPRILASGALFLNSTFRNNANGLVCDSGSMMLRNCSVTDNLHNGLLYLNSSVPESQMALELAGSDVSRNTKSGILANADRITLDITNSTIEDNTEGGLIVIADDYVNATLTGSSIKRTTKEGGVGIWGTSNRLVIRADLSDNNISSTRGPSPVRLGFRTAEVPVHSVFLNMTGNNIWDAGTADGLVMAIAVERIHANLTDNNLVSPSTQNGVHIGLLSKEFNTNPSVKYLKADLHGNEISNIASGALRLCAIKRIDCNITENHIYHPTGLMACGSVTVGWFNMGDGATPEHATVSVKNNLFEGILDSGALGVKAIYNLNTTIENNTVSGVGGGGFKLGWIDDAEYRYTTEPWGLPTRNVRAKICNNVIDGGSGPGIWLYSSAGSEIFDNTIADKTGFVTNSFVPGDGIRLQRCNGATEVTGNQVSGSKSCGIHITESTEISVHHNTLAGNEHGIGLSSGARGNILFQNTVTKTSAQYGFYLTTDSLNNTHPANNTVNGEWLRHFHGIHGTAGSLVQIQGHDVQEPLMSNLGQLIVANSTRVALSDCLLSNGRNGMYLHEVDNSTINNNLLFNNTALSVSSGISIGKGCEDNVLSANTLTNNFYGLYVGQGVRGNRLWGNTISKAAAQTGVFLTTDGTSYDNEFPTNNTVEGTPLRYYYGEAGLSLADIAIATSNMMNVGQMAIIASEDTSLSRISLSGGSTGLYLLHANGTRASNLSLSGNANNLACQRSDDARLADSWLANGTTNINLGNVTGFVAENSTLFGGLTSIRAAFSQASLRNSTLANSTYLSVSLLFFSLLDLVNTTHHNSSVVENSTLDVLWHFDISAFCNGQPVENATVSLANASGAAALSGATGADGTLPRSLVREYTKTANGTLHHSPHSLTVSKPTLGNYTVMLDFNRSHPVAAVLGDLTSPALTDGPAVSPASIGTSIDIAWLNATISDQGIYPGAIAAAEWYPSQSRPAILNGTGFPMLPSDGALDSRTESLHAELDLTSYSKGGRTFWAHGRDSAGHWCEWQPVSVTIVDDQGPAVTGQATLMPVTVTTRDSLIWIRLTLDDSGLGDSKITGATFEAFTPGHGTAMLTVAQLTAQDGIINGMNETLTAEVDISGLEKGSHILNITGTDEFGNLGAARGLTLTISDGEAPGQPQGLNATYTGEGAAELTWTANTEDDLAGYRIYRSMHSGSNYQLIGTAGPDSASWNDTGLQEGSTYYYVISAFDDASAPNVSPYSTEVKLLAQEQSMLERAPVPFLAIIAAATLLAVLFGGAYIMTKRKPKKPSDAEGPTDSSI